MNVNKSWVETTLGDIAIWGSGGTPKRSESKYYNGDIPWLKTGDLNNSDITFTSESITEEGLNNSSAKLFPVGSICIAMYGATIGKLGKLRIEASTNQACAVGIPSAKLSSDFLFYYLKSQKEDFIEKGKGGAQPNISQTVIKAHRFPLPPLAEQQRIVAKLDSLFGHLDILKERLARIPELIKDFRQSVLTQAVTGKLTEEWREGKELGEWEESRIDTLASLINGYAFKSAVFTEEGFQLVRMGNLYKDRLDLKRNPVFLSSRTEARIVDKYSTQKGDILISLTGTKYKRDYGYAIQIGVDDKLLVNQRILCLRSIQNSEYLYILVRSELFRDEFFKTETGGNNQGNVSSKNVASISLLTPGLKEQKEIVRRVESLFAKADAITARYETLRTQIEDLPQAILAKAFRGELVPQLPGDGDARELLEEIRRVRAEMEGKGKGKKARIKKK